VGDLTDDEKALLTKLIELCMLIARNAQVTKMEPKQLAICLGPSMVHLLCPALHICLCRLSSAVFECRPSN